MPKTQPPSKSQPVPVEATLHLNATRKNIPTEELRDFVNDDESSPQNIRYPRDPSLDPQLVWKGKDEQNQEDLSVPLVPIYIQEKIHPKALIDALPRQSQPADAQLDLFSTFDGPSSGFEQKIEFYQHDQQWSNRMILGDSLLVMTSLAEKEGLKGKIQTIYFDPPYGIKFNSNWQVSTRKRDIKDGKIEDITRQPEQIRAFRDTWELGIHSFLTYIRDRLTSARELLTESGSIFVQIGDENVHLVRSLLDEVFGSENFVSMITVKKTGGLGTDLLKNVSDYILWFARNKNHIKYRQIFYKKIQGEGESTGERYDQILLLDGSRRSLTKEERINALLIPKGGRTYQLDNLASSGTTPTCVFDFEYNGVIYRAGGQRSWKTNFPGMIKLSWANRLHGTGKSLRYVRFFDDFSAFEISNVWTDVAVGTDKIYVVQTPTSAIERCLLMTTDPGDLVLDPTCGSGTTAYVAEQWGRRWITVDTSRVALALARTRLMSAKYPFYLLADSTEGIKKESELTKTKPSTRKPTNDIRQGFVYKRVPHVTLKSIANNPDIKEGMTREEIDAAIARHAETETLYDQPYEDKKAIRVTGPMTVESLSPHRMLGVDTSAQDTPKSQKKAAQHQDFATMILDNLRKAGAQNTKKNERITFDRLDPFAGLWIHATGEYTDKEGHERRIAVSIGPEHGTVGPQQVKEAAKEAVQGIGFDLLLICGFAFDPHVSEESKRYGKLVILPTKMNPDLAMGEDLLKKTGAGNLFMIFGEPDVDIQKTKSGLITVEIKGVDVYDPTTSAIRPSSTDDIACWFIDTNYDGESFFVRHAYFTGADKPYEKLKRALRAEIDETAWAALYSTKSQPFSRPESGKIAVKAINHYGDEVLKVFDIK